MASSKRPSSKNWFKIVFAFLLVLLLVIWSAVLFQYLVERSKAEDMDIQEKTIETRAFCPTNLEKVIKDPETGIYMEGGVIMVVAAEGVSAAEVASLVEPVQGEVVGGTAEELEELGVFEVAILEKDAASLWQAIAELEGEPELETLVPNYLPDPSQPQEVKVPHVPKWQGLWSDLLHEKKRWGQEYINMPQVWAVSTGAPQLKLAVMEMGFDLTHQDLHQHNILITVDDIPSHQKKDSYRSHGNGVSSIMGATATNMAGMAGIMWEPQLYCYQITSSKDIKTALWDAYQQGIRVINMSMGINLKNVDPEDKVKQKFLFQQSKRIMEPYIERVGERTEVNRGLLLVTSAGNEEDIRADYNMPGGLSTKHCNVMAVGAVDAEGGNGTS